MRFLRLVAISAVLCLACSDSTGISVQGPSFMRARIDGSPFVLEEHDSFLWTVNGTTLVVQGLPGTLAPAGNQYFDIQVGNYRGPGQYPLEETTAPGAISAGFYGVFDGLGVPTQSFQTMGEYKGSVRIIAEDTTSGTIVGTFEFSAGATMGTPIEVHVTEGSFRIRH